jgi:hypothetical protein
MSEIVSVEVPTPATDTVTETVIASSDGVHQHLSTVDADVQNVEQCLEEHAEQSEIRHEEILEGQAWHEKQFQLLSNQLQAQATQATTLQSLLASIQATLTELNLKLSTGSNHSTPSTQENVTEPTTEIVNPESVAVEKPVPPTKEKRRRVI